MHPCKELHYFDTLFSIRSRHDLKELASRELKREIDAIARTERDYPLGDIHKCWLRTNSILATAEIEEVDYLDLFFPLATKKSVLGEVTPEYMLLDQSQAAAIKGKLGSDTSIILILRDPTERILSAAKLFHKYHSAEHGSAEITLWMRKQLEDETPWMKAQDKYNDYARAVDTYTSLFSRFLAIDLRGMIANPHIAAEFISAIADIEIQVDSLAKLTAEPENALGTIEITDDWLINSLNSRYDTQKAYMLDLFRESPIYTS